MFAFDTTSLDTEKSQRKSLNETLSNQVTKYKNEGKSENQLCKGIKSRLKSERPVTAADRFSSINPFTAK